jgi:hypothetical protein
MRLLDKVDTASAIDISHFRTTGWCWKKREAKEKRKDERRTREVSNDKSDLTTQRPRKQRRREVR